MSGWIKSHRKLLDNPIVCKDSDHLAIWMYLLLNATHKDMQVVFMGEKITLYPGQLITGRKSISEKFNISESKVQRVLKTFEIEQQIEQQTGNKNRVITVLSWSDYQDSEQQTEQQLNNKRTTTEQQLNTNKKERTKELKNKELKDKDNTFSAYTSNPEFLLTLNSFEEFRNKIKKPMTDKAKKMLVEKLDKLATTDEEKITILNESIFNGWQGVFELKSPNGSSKIAQTGQAARMKTKEEYEEEQRLKMERSRLERGAT